MSKLRTLFLLACCLVITGCGQPASVPPVIERDAYAKKLADGAYEVQLRYSVTSSGGPCLSKDMLTTWTSYSTNWIYLKTLDGTMTADQIVVTIDAGKKEWPYATTNMQGTVSFSNTAMTVLLEKPGFDYNRNVEQGVVPYFLNGVYQVTERPR